MFLYKITNAVNGKAYVGITRYSLGKRMAEHIRNAKRNSNLLLPRAIRKHGVDSFHIESLATAESWEQLQQLERDAIARLGTTQKHVGYNMTTGGEGIQGLAKTDEWRRAMSARFKGRKFTPEHRAKLSLAHTGKLNPHKGVPLSYEAKRKLSATITGRKHSPEWCRRIGDANRGKLLGRKLSEEHKAKIGLGVLRYRAENREATPCP